MRRINIATGAFIITVFLQATGITGQGITFHQNNDTETIDECITGADMNHGRIILKGDLSMTQDVHPSIIFDLKSKLSVYKQLCIIDTTNNCQDSSVQEDCYCTATATADQYRLVVNISSNISRNQDFISGSLLYKNGSKSQFEHPLPRVEDFIDKEITYMSINGKLAETICNQTLHDKELSIEAKCRIPRKTCWLELWVDDNSTKIVESGSITSRKTLSEQTEFNITLRRSVCDKDKFQTVHHCFLRILPESSDEESAEHFFIIIYIAAAVIGVVTIITAIVCIVFKKRSKKRKSQNIANKKDEKRAAEKGLLLPETSFETKNHEGKPLPPLPNHANTEDSVIEEEIPPKKPPRLHSVTSSEFQDNPPTSNDSVKIEVLEKDSQEHEDVENKIQSLA